MKPSPLPSALACLLVALAAAPAAQADPLPCADPRGCPDLVVDDPQLAVGGQTLEEFGPDDCPVLEGSTQPGLRQLLRFTTTSANLGDGDLFVGGPDTAPELFEWDPCHGHYHYRQYADYRLWTPEAWLAWDSYRNADPGAKASEVLAAHPELADGFVSGVKRGFCLEDVAPALPNRHAPPVVPDPLPKYDGCADDQGISVGWSDVYDASLDGQWIDVTEVAPGPYVLEVEVNGEHVFGETDFGDNRGWTPTVVAPGPFNNGVADLGPALGIVDAVLDAVRGVLVCVLGVVPDTVIDLQRDLDGLGTVRLYVALLDGHLHLNVTTPLVTIGTGDEGLP